MTDRDYMLRAIELAKKGLGFTNPNPMVGAVIVKDGRIIGEGYHKRCGELHAERNAIAALTESAEGATIYVTLEPCCHYGKTPPCTEAIIENKIAKVVIGSRDPNPLVAGKGAKILREHGIEVVEDFLKEECDEFNSVFFHYITTKRPYVTVKYAMTADGKIATKTGASKWITGEEARNEVQQMRHKSMAIMAGIGTVLADDPMLNVRVEGLKSPIRVICDSKLRIPLDSQIVKTAAQYRTIIACGYSKEDIEYLRDSDDKPLQEVLHKNEQNSVSENEKELYKKIKELTNQKVEILSAPDENGRVDIKTLLGQLGELGIDSIFVEGGGILNDSLFKAGEVNRLEVFVAPKVFGGADAKSPVEGCGVEEVAQASLFSLIDVRKIGNDVLLSYERK